MSRGDKGQPSAARQQLTELEQENARLRAEVLSLQQCMQAASEAEAGRRAVLDASLDSIITIDQESRVVEWNQAAERTFGYSRSVALGSHLADLIIPPELQEAHRQGMARYLSSGEGPVLWQRVEWQALHASGERLLVELAISPLEIRREPHFTAYVRDISTRHKAEAELRDSEARYRLLAENATDIILRTDLDGCRRYVSPACLPILGFRPEELIGTHLRDNIHPDDLATATSNLEALLAGKVDQETTTYRMRHKSGHWVWLEAKRRLVRDQQGRALEAISVLRDISERTQLQERLRHSQKMEAMGQPTGGIAHDFNNLLTVILSNAEVLLEETDDPSLRGLASVILETAERGADLTRHLLAFGRRQALKPVQVSLDHVVRGMIPLLQRTLGEHIELRTQLATGELSALTDRTLLESAILNLAVNSRDAMLQGGTLTIRTGERTAGSGEGSLPIGQAVVYVTVSDTGIGMTPEVLEHVFEPFFTTKDVGEGSGLGLAMVQGFAEQTGSYVAIESSPGQGTSVTIVIPAVTTQVVEPPEAQDEARALAKGTERILVVEDEPKVLQFVSSQLLSLGYDVTAVSNGPDAADLLERDPSFDLLFTDVVMPKGMSGVELARRARAIKSDLRILLTSGHSQDVFERHGRPASDIGLLRKPYRRSELAKAVKEALSKPRPQNSRAGRLLLVDDQLHNRDVVLKLLASAGYQVEIATNGAEAVEAVQSGVYDLVLMDIQMPVMNGDVAARTIRSLDHPSRQVPIIAISGNVSPPQVRLFQEAGINDCISKPFKRAELIKKVTSWLQRQPPRPEGAERPSGSRSTAENTGLSEILELMGRDWVESGLRRLKVQIDEAFGDEAAALADQAELARRAHALVAHSALLGFAEMSKHCSLLEEACGSGRAVRARFQAAKEAAERAAEQADELLIK